MSKLATIYQRKGSLFVSASHKTEAGFWVADAEVKIVDPADEFGLKKAIDNALARSLEGVPTPARDANLTASLLNAANVSSWDTFSKMAKCVDVFATESLFEITPYQSVGGSGGYKPMTESVIHLAGDVTNIAASVLGALAEAK